jgi:hypothetical protein
LFGSRGSTPPDGGFWSTVNELVRQVDALPATSTARTRTVCEPSLGTSISAVSPYCLRVSPPSS